MHKTLQIPVFLKAKQKNTVNYSIFGGLIAKKSWYLHGFCNFKKTWKARTTVNSGVVASLDAETLVFTQFFARGGTKPL